VRRLIVFESKRLSAKGVASIAPAASTDDEAGGARNRRVELVKVGQS